MVVVYEPARAIGGEEPADAGRVGLVVEHLKAALRSLGARSPEVVYGGTVTDGNIARFADPGVLDGVGATRAALDAGRFLAMVEEVASRTVVE